MLLYLDFTVRSLSVIFTAAAVFLGITAYHSDSESDWEFGSSHIVALSAVRWFVLQVDQFGDSLFWIFGTLLVSTLIMKNSRTWNSKFGDYVLATVTITTQTVTESGVVNVASQASAAPSNQNHLGHVAGSVIQAHPIAAGLVILAGGAIVLVGAEVVATTGIKATVAVAKATANGTIWLASKSVQMVLAAKGRLFGADDAVDAAVNELANAVQLEGQPNVDNNVPMQANIPGNVIAAPQQLTPVQYGGQQELFPVRQIEGRNYPGDGPEGLSRLPDVDFRKYSPAYSEVDSQRSDVIGEHKKNA